MTQQSELFTELSRVLNEVADTGKLAEIIVPGEPRLEVGDITRFENGPNKYLARIMEVEWGNATGECVTTYRFRVARCNDEGDEA